MIISDQVWLIYGCLTPWNGFCELLPDVPVGLKGQIYWSSHIFCLFWLKWSHSVKACHAGKDRTGVKRFGLYQCIPANTSEPFRGSGTSLGVPTVSGVAVPARVTSAAQKVTSFPKLEVLAQGRTSEVLSDLCDRRAPVAASTQRSTKSCVALTGLCVPAVRRARWCWAVGTPSWGGGSRGTLRLPGWGSGHPWGLPVCARSPGRMISRSQIPTA